MYSAAVWGLFPLITHRTVHSAELKKHRHRGNGQPTSNLTTLIDVYELPSSRIDEKGDSLLPL